MVDTAPPVSSHEVPAGKPEGDRNIGVLAITPEGLASVLGLRHGIAVVDIRRDLFRRNSIEILLEGEGLPLVPYGSEVPWLDPESVRA